MILPQQNSRPSRSRLVAKAVAATKLATDKKAPAKSTEMSPETAADLYRDMMLGRDFEDMCAQMYYRGKMFGAHRRSSCVPEPIPPTPAPPPPRTCMGPIDLPLSPSCPRTLSHATKHVGMRTRSTQSPSHIDAGHEGAAPKQGAAA